MTIYINIFGGPGAGKSTIAADLFVLMKKSGYNVELVTEVAKDFVLENRSTKSSAQVYITMLQFHNLARLKEKVDYVITDAPILLGCVYADLYAPNLPASYKQLIVDLHKQELQPSVNIFITREFSYVKDFRNETEKEAMKIDESILNLLDSFSEQYVSLNPVRKTNDFLMLFLKNQLTNLKL
jgi:predicted ATPase